MYLEFKHLNMLKKIRNCILEKVLAVYRHVLYQFSDKRFILFNVVRENHYLMFEPLYERLKRDPRLNLYFTSSWERKEDGPVPTEVLLGKHNIRPDRIISPFQARWRRWDICAEVDYKFARNFWPATRIQMFHGFNGKFRDKGRDGTIHQLISKFDALFCFSHTHERLFKESGYLKKNCRTFCIGFPKLDKILCAEPTRETILKDYGANPEKRSILYAPSWNSQLSLNNIGEDLIELLCRTGWTVMVKPHPMSLQTFGDLPDYKRHDWHQYLSRLHQEGRMIYVTEQNSCRYLKASDILISDHGSTVYEFMVLNRPILYYDTDEAESVMTIKQHLPKLRRVVLPFQTPREAIDIIRKEAWNDHPVETDIRRELIDFRFYDIGRATDRALQAMYSLMQLAPVKDQVNHS